MTTTDAIARIVADVQAYHARDQRIAIDLPILQDNGEWEYPGSIDGILIGFYRTRSEADLALHNILALEMPGAFGSPDVDYAPVGWE